MRRAVGGTGLPSYPSPRSESPSLSLSRQRLLGVGEGSRGSVWIPGTMRLKLPRSMIVLFLFIINLLNYMDRLTIAGIISELQLPPSLGGFGITDSEAGILSSIFVFTYMLLSPVFGFLGDRVPRKAIMAIGVLVWASSTFLCSFASSYSQLLVFRSMVGFGEASYATIAPTLIADLFPVDRRATALAFYFVATPVGSALGYLVAGEMAYIFNWRWAFRVTPPLAVFFMGILFFFADEPPRGAMEHGMDHQPIPTDAGEEEDVTGEEDEGVAEDKLSLSDFFDDLIHIWRIRSFSYSTLAFTAITFVSGALAQWGPSFLQRLNCTEDETMGRCKSQINSIFGILGCVTGVIGTLLGALLSQRFAKVSDSSDAIICGVGTLISAPFISVCIYLAPISMNYTWAAIFVAEMCLGVTWAPVTAMMLYVMQPTQRSFAAGIQTLTSHLFGDALSPIFVGWFADNLYLNNEDETLSRAQALQLALYPTSVFGLIGAIFFFVAARYVGQDRRNVELRDLDALRSGGSLQAPGEAFFQRQDGNTSREPLYAEKGSETVFTST